MARPRKTGLGKFRYSWQATEAVKYIQSGLATMQQYGNESPEFDEACRRMGRWFLECCSVGNPAKFLHQVASEFEGNLMHSPADENYNRAWLDCVAYNLINNVRRYPTFAEWKKRLRGNGSLAADSSLRRSMKRLGLELAPAEGV